MKGIINRPFVNVRKSPDGEKAKVLKGGTSVSVKSIEDGWAKIRGGYVKKELIDIIEGDEEE